ncbi:hypothetical protein LPN04_03870 [Rugamonas sp. A1-17]|nr:hypothetical protein [Rugamonas sp. A1-17]
MADFDKDSHTPAFVCPHVFREERPVKLVSHADGDWQFLCGEIDHFGDGHVVGIAHLLERDPGLLVLADLATDWEAERDDVGGTWRRVPCALNE